jgi:very-short-patch-repair endonuclease
MERLSTREFARKLRREQTDAERGLWSRLRRKRLGVKFRRQHPIDRFIVDFCCIERRVIVELDGSGHETKSEYDEQRSKTLAAHGYQGCAFPTATCCSTLTAWSRKSSRA